MYRSPEFDVTETDAIFGLIERSPFGQLVSHDGTGFEATGLPFLVDRHVGALGTLKGHVARANPHWKRLASGDDLAEVIVIFDVSDAYVSPSAYPSKAEHGRVVPTWNYEVVHAHGRARIHDDVDWLRRLVTDLTDHHEAAAITAGRNAMAGPWAVTDAPAGFIDRQLRAIVGVDVEIERLEGKRKLSQNRPADDRAGVVADLRESSVLGDRAVAETMAVLDDS